MSFSGSSTCRLWRVSEPRRVQALHRCWSRPVRGAVAMCVGIWLWRGLRSHEDIGLGGKINRLVGELLGQGLPAVDFAHCDLTAGEQSPEQHGCGLSRREDCLGLDPALELLMQPFDGVGRACTLP